MSLKADSHYCYNCFKKGLASFIEIGGLKGPEAFQLLQKALKEIQERLKEFTPPIAGAPVYAMLRKRFSEKDIYEPEKRRITMSLKAKLPDLRDFVQCTDNPLKAALVCATWANLIDVAQGHPLPETAYLFDIFSNPLAIDETDLFLEKLDRSRKLLILGDNAGETVLDRLVLEYISKSEIEIKYSIRPLPVLNDAIFSDARMAGIDNFAELVDTGFDAPTVIFDCVSSEMKEEIRTADLILSKGQGNLEGLFGTKDPRLFYSFVVKCPVLARAVGKPTGSGIFASSISVH